MKRIKERTQMHLDDYAAQGLRTLCVAMKVIFLLMVNGTELAKPQCQQ